MTTYVALLRGINVGGHKQVAMSDLRDLLTQLGFGDARSLLQSGNLVFPGDARTGAHLERLLEAEAAKRLALQTAFLVRTAGNGRRPSRTIRSGRKPSAIPATSSSCF